MLGLELNNLGFDYSEISLFKQVSFKLHSGQLLHIQGANGTGKTTLLKIIAGLLTPNQGQVITYGNTINYIGHQWGLNLSLTVKEHCYFNLALDNETEILLKLFDLAKVAHLPCGYLSNGQKKKLALLRLKSNKANCWLLDEPLVTLDVGGLKLLTTLITEHLANQGIVIITSHQRLPFDIPYQVYQL